MSDQVAGRPIAGTTVPASFVERIYGLGGVFGKTVRDSRRATLAVGGILGLLLIGVSKAIVTEFATPASRQEIADLVAAVPPLLQGFAGRPIAVDTLGGYLSYKYGTFFPLVASLWSILALSATLAGEAQRGSLEFVAGGPIARRRLALEKLGGHLAGLAVATILIFAGLLVAGTFATLPGDEIPIAAAAGYSLWLALLALASGAVAFAVAPVLGRGPALGIAGAVTFGGFIINGYQSAIPVLAPLANLTWFGWTTNHIPLAGMFDWASLGLVAVAAVVLLVVGVEAFARRDLGATSAIALPRLPDALVGLGGPARRAFGQSWAAAASWGIGLGIFGLAIAGSGDSFLDELASAPEFRRLLDSVFPGLDVASVGGFLQLVFVEFGLVLAGLAAATVVAVWASDETSGRLDFLLATPLSRRRWVVAGWLGSVGALALIVALAAVGVAAGTLTSGGSVATPVTGTVVLFVYGIALVGIGVAVGGVLGTGYAAPTVILVTVATWFADILGPALGLPEFLHELSLTSHYGLPMLGSWEPAGVIASLTLAIGGIGLGAWGFGRRDLRT